MTVMAPRACLASVARRLSCQTRQAASYSHSLPPRTDVALAVETRGQGTTVRVAPCVRYRSGEASRVHEPMTWRIDVCGSQRQGEWREPLMGWTSSPDPYAAMNKDDMTFPSLQTAREFAALQGWVVAEVSPPPAFPATNKATIPGMGQAPRCTGRPPTATFSASNGAASRSR
jgi:hypothetical protein